MDQFDDCFSRAFAELDSVLAKVHILEDWQLISRVASVIWTFIEEGREKGCDGASAARYYLAKALREAGVDLYKPYYAYLHGTREDVVEVLRDIFPNLVDVRGHAPASPRRTARSEQPSLHAAEEGPKGGFAPDCFAKAFMELGEVMAKAHLLDDWQLVSRIAHVVYTFIEEGKENGCDGASAALTYITEALERAGIDRFKTYRAYLHGTREDVLRVVRQIFPYLAEIRRPYAVAEVERPSPPHRWRQLERERAPASRPASLAASAKPPWKPRGRKAVGRGVAALAALIIAVAVLHSYSEIISLVLHKPANVETLYSSRGLSTELSKSSVPLTYTTSQISIVYTTTTTSLTHFTTPSSFTTWQITTSAITSREIEGLDDAAGFISAAVEAINNERAALGIPPATPTVLKAAEFKARYLAHNNHLSHYDKEGRHPIYYYTKLDGGLYAVEENGFACFGCSVSAKWGREMVREMVHNDALSLWGHRDSILDPCHNRVAVAVARNGSSVYAVVYMVGEWAQWVEGPLYRDGVFHVKGYVKLPPPEKLYDGRPLYPVVIHCDKPNPDYYWRHSYSTGEICAGVLPQNVGQYPNIQTIYADVYTVVKSGHSWLIDLKFRYKPPPGTIATVIIYAGSTGVKWSPMAPGGKGRLKYCRVLNYVIEG